MGTNFYCRHIPTESEHAEIQQALTNKQYEQVKKILNEKTQQYHIGKRSYGWQFLFQVHNMDRCREYEIEAQVPWGDDTNAMIEYLKRDDVQIFDEYGEEFTFDQFWNDEIGYCLYNDEEHMNTEQYYEKYPEYKPSYQLENTQEEKNGFRIEYRWFS